VTFKWQATPKSDRILGTSLSFQLLASRAPNVLSRIDGDNSGNVPMRTFLLSHPSRDYAHAKRAVFSNRLYCTRADEQVTSG
jgi:hypothetical protein